MGLDFLERGLGDGPYLAGAEFTAADVMMGFSLVAARVLGLLDAEHHPALAAYLDRLQSRPAFQKAAGTS
jgi:glutathione S-transferase